MIVWRVEKKGVGPYNHPDCPVSRELSWAHNTPRWPTLYEEGGRMRRKLAFDKTRHGFRRLRDLRAWFSAANRLALRGASYVLAIYNVPGPAVLGVGPRTGQVVFDPEAATLLEMRPVPR